MSIAIQKPLAKWVEKKLNLSDLTFEPLLAEASTRLFWRIRTKTTSFVVMHSPPDTENNEQFIRLSRVFSANRVPVPQVHASDLTRGFLLVDDVGDSDFRNSYEKADVRSLFTQALDALLAIQATEDSCIPTYTGERLRDELNIFYEWICDDTCAMSAEPVAAITENLVNEINGLPKVTVHRDFHSRNLLLREGSSRLGVVDFQDALVGPITYDIASLLYDCYYAHKEADIKHFIDKYLMHTAHDLGELGEPKTFAEAVRFTAIQRLLKAAGIFVRLWRTRGRNSHLHDVLPTLRKAAALSQSIPKLNEFGDWLSSVVVPKTAQQLGQR